MKGPTKYNWTNYERNEDRLKENKTKLISYILNVKSVGSNALTKFIKETFELQTTCGPHASEPSEICNA